MSFNLQVPFDGLHLHVLFGQELYYTFLKRFVFVVVLVADLGLHCFATFANVFVTISRHKVFAVGRYRSLSYCRF